MSTTIASAIDYTDAPFAVREDFAQSHNRYWDRLQTPGCWWTSAEKLAIAREVRQATNCRHCDTLVTALSPHRIEGQHDSAPDALEQLPSVAVDAVHRIVRDCSRLTQAWYHQCLADGLSEGAYIELVGTVVSVFSIDCFATALGLPLLPLPVPGIGEPSGYRPPTAAADDAWVPMVPVDNADSAEADLWPANRTGNVVRALSLVPDEVRTLKDLSAAHYLAMKDVAKDGHNAGRALSRAQMELLAGRTSALNACYY